MECLITHVVEVPKVQEFQFDRRVEIFLKHNSLKKGNPFHLIDHADTSLSSPARLNLRHHESMKRMLE